MKCCDLTNTTQKFFTSSRSLFLATAVSIATVSSLSLSPTANAAGDKSLAPEERMILDAQALELNLSARDATQSQSSGFQLAFSAYDRDFLIDLVPNKELTRYIQSDPSTSTDIYRGKLVGVANSWARISQTDGVYSGAIFDGEELFIVEKYATVAADIAPWMQAQMQADQPQSVVFKYSDVVDSAECGTEEAPTKRSRYRAFIDDLRSSLSQSDDLTALAAAELQVNVTIVADTQYVSSSNGNVNGQVLEQMNIVDGIFSEQIGVQFGIQRIIPLSNNGTLTSTNPSTLLGNFRTYVNNQIGNPGLAHLFTGKNLNGNVIGIAYLRALCGSSGVGVTQAGGRGVTGALTAAHEFGHNFGAPHDNQSGSACSTTGGGFLMNPSINGSRQFSQCSRQQIANVVNNASCLVPGSTPAPTPTPPPAPGCAQGALNLTNVTTYSGNNTGSASVSANGCSITLTGNSWRITNAGFDIDESTTVSFDFTAQGTGEIQGVGFDNDRTASANRIFQLTGTQNWGIRDFSYSGNGQAQRITIPVGEFYTGNDLGFVIANDKDSGTANNTVIVSNVVINQDDAVPTPTPSCIDLQSVSAFSNTNSGSFTANSCSMTLNGNIWRRTNETFNIGPNTRLTFDFNSNGAGEIHGIGFDENNTASRNRIFQLDGSQNWGIRDFSYTGGTQSFDIPIGQYYTGSAMRLILVNDKDSGTGNNQTVISNVRLID